jgi:hypothetical protein
MARNVNHQTPVGTEVHVAGSNAWGYILRHSVAANGREYTHIRLTTGPRRGRDRKVLTSTVYLANPQW